MTLPSPSPLFDRWALSPERVFLNHGSFGATPREVLAEQVRWRAELEAEPVGFFVERHWDVMDAARAALGRFVGASPDDLAFVPNATIGVATVIGSLGLRPGDEVIASVQEYPACQNGLRAAVARAGAKVVYADVPFPVSDPGEFVAAYERAASPRTRLALVSHVTSPTGLVLPVAEICRVMGAKGIDVLVDGAHAPGMLPLNLAAVGAAYYTGNCHKWMGAPKGVAFLFAREDTRGGVRPLVLSNNAEKPRTGRSQFRTEFDFVGTQDYTGFYCLPKAIEVMGGMVAGGWPAVMSENRDLAVRMRRMLCERWGVRPPAPESMLGSIATIILPGHDAARHARLMARPSKYHDAMQDQLLRTWKIQVPVWGLPTGMDRFLRISAQLHNAEAQYEYLAQAVKSVLEYERTL